MRPLLSPHFLHTSAILLLLPTLTSSQIGNAYQDITTMPAYASLKPCAQNCFVQTGFCPNDLLGSKIGCRSQSNCKSSNWEATNDCYCRSDLQKAAQDYLTSCVDVKCTVGDVKIDQSAAGGIYAQYCSGKGYTSAARPASVSASATKAGTGGVAATAGSGLNGPQETGTSSSSGSSPDSGPKKMSTATIIGIVVGSLAALTFLSIFIRLMLKWCGCVGRPTPHGGSQLLPQQQQQPLPYYQQPSYPMNLYPEQGYWQQKAVGTESEIGPDDSISVVTPPNIAPTMVSNGL